MTWLIQSIIATLLLIPAWTAVGFFNRNFGIPSSVFLMWYFLGVVVATLFYVGPKTTLSASPWIMIAMLFVGLLIGGIGNVLLFSAVSSAPNPGLPLAISSFANIGVYLLAPLLFIIMPKYFGYAKIEPWGLLGVFLTVLGVAIISLKS